MELEGDIEGGDKKQPIYISIICTYNTIYYILYRLSYS